MKLTLAPGLPFRHKTIRFALAIAVGGALTLLWTLLPYPLASHPSGSIRFDGIEVGTIGDPKVADEVKDASAKSGLTIHSVMNADHWK